MNYIMYLHIFHLAKTLYKYMVIWSYGKGLTMVHMVE